MQPHWWDAWFGRITYERDAWDVMLEEWAQAQNAWLAITVGFVGIALQEVMVLHDPRFALNGVILAIAYVVVLAIVLGYMSAYEEQSRRAIVRLATWAAPAAPDDDEFHVDLLGHVADTMKAPRVVLVPLRPPVPSVEMAVAWRREETSATLAEFVKIARQTFARTRSRSAF